VWWLTWQALMPDPLHWLGVTKIHRFISMSDMKYDAITKSGITIVERVPIPPELVPKDAAVEITAKVRTVPTISALPVRKWLSSVFSHHISDRRNIIMSGRSEP
jgi:hypothetical protein